MQPIPCYAVLSLVNGYTQRWEYDAAKPNQTLIDDILADASANIDTDEPPRGKLTLVYRKHIPNGVLYSILDDAGYFYGKLLDKQHIGATARPAQP